MNFKQIVVLTHSLFKLIPRDEVIEFRKHCLRNRCPRGSYRVWEIGKIFGMNIEIKIIFQDGPHEG